MLIVGPMTSKKGTTEAAAPSDGLVEVAIGIENMRRMFRQTMARRAREAGEDLEDARARLARDPQTARLAQLLGATVDELLTGFGGEERFITAASYDPKTERERVEVVIARVASTPIGLNDASRGDAVERAARRSAPLAAPRIGERGRVRGDTRDVLRITRERTRGHPIARAPGVTKSFGDRWR